VDCVQAVTDKPLCLDSANPRALAAALERVTRLPMINSISGETHRLEGVLRLVPGRACGVVALLLDDAGIPRDVAGRLVVARRLLERTRGLGVPDEQVYVDPRRWLPGWTRRSWILWMARFTANCWPPRWSWVATASVGRTLMPSATTGS
jgi:cobalamin-dependent methionine synthase I